jgi:hypothetical protein
VGEPARQLPQRIKALSTFHALEILSQFLVRRNSPVVLGRPFFPTENSLLAS